MSIKNTNDMLKAAKLGQYAIGAFNVENMEFVQAVIEAAYELKSPVIIATSVNTLKYATPETFVALVETIASSTNIPVAIHLDHGESFFDIMKTVKGGYKSVMYDGSKLSFIENVEETKRVVDICKLLDISVEGELGAIGGKPGDPNIEKLMYTKVETAINFVENTGVNSLAVAIGTAHGIYKSTPKLDYDRLKSLSTNLDVPLVLHGASGLSDEQLKQCIINGICKVNIATELRIAWTNTIKSMLINNPDKFDPKVSLKIAREAVKNVVKEKILVLGSAGKCNG